LNFGADNERAAEVSMLRRSGAGAGVERSGHVAAWRRIAWIERHGYKVCSTKNEVRLNPNAHVSISHTMAHGALYSLPRAGGLRRRR
jgi:hypothetical protein